MESLKVLAVADPAVSVYKDQKFKILEGSSVPAEITVLPWAEYYGAMMDALEGRSYYDVVMIAGHLWMKDFIEKGYIHEINLDEEDILPGILNEINYNGKYYLSPSFCDGHIITYRKSIVEKYFRHLPEEVISPDEYCKMVESVYYGTGRPAVAMKADKSEIFTDALPFMRMYGGDAYNDDAVHSVNNSIDTVNGLRKYVEMKKYAAADTEHYGNDEIASSIKNAEVPIATTWSGQMGVVYSSSCKDKEDLGFATFLKPWNVTWSFAVNSRSSHKEEAECLLRYLRSPEVDLIAGRYSGCPVRRRSYEIDKDRYPWYSCQAKMFELTASLPLLENAGDKNQVFYDKIFEAFTGSITAEDAMNEIEHTISKMNGGETENGKN